MEVVEIIKPVVYGGAVLFLFAWVGFIVWWASKRMGISFKKKPKVSKVILEDVAKQVVALKKTFQQFGGYISKFPLTLQEQYIEGYNIVKKLEGGANV